MGSDRSSVSSQESDNALGSAKKDKMLGKEEIPDDIELDSDDKFKTDNIDRVLKRNLLSDKCLKEEHDNDQEMEVFKGGSKDCRDKSFKKGSKGDGRMMTRPRRDSSSSLTAATELKAKKEEIGEAASANKKPVKKNDNKKLRDDDDKSDGSTSTGKVVHDKTKKMLKKKIGIGPQSPSYHKSEKNEDEENKNETNLDEEEGSSDLDSICSQPIKKRPSKSKSKLGTRQGGSDNSWPKYFVHY